MPTEWEEIFASYTPDKRLTTRIYKGAQNTKLRPKINDLMKKGENELNRAFPKEEVQITKKHMKNCSASLAIKEMQIKITSSPPHSC
jgi:hypothetical protein